MSEFCFLPVMPFTSGEEHLIQSAIHLLETRLRQPGKAFNSSTATRDWLRLQLAHQEREIFMVLYLDNQNRLLEKETLFLGTINSTEIHPREIVKGALRHNAAAVILAHNHPSGCIEPSQADKTITQRLVQALGLVEVRVLDHLIVGRTDILSFAEHGLV